MSINNNATLPKAPKDLCFSELDFIQVWQIFLFLYIVLKEIDIIFFFIMSLYSVYRTILM